MRTKNCLYLRLAVKGFLGVERGMRMNSRLQRIMEHIVAQMDDTEIERISRVQPRGAYSLAIENGTKSIPMKKRRGWRTDKFQEELELAFG